MRRALLVLCVLALALPTVSADFGPVFTWNFASSGWAAGRVQLTSLDSFGFSWDVEGITGRYATFALLTTTTGALVSSFGSISGNDGGAARIHADTGSASPVDARVPYAPQSDVAQTSFQCSSGCSTNGGTFDVVLIIAGEFTSARLSGLAKGVGTANVTSGTEATVFTSNDFRGSIVRANVAGVAASRIAGGRLPFHVSSPAFIEFDGPGFVASVTHTPIYRLSGPVGTRGCPCDYENVGPAGMPVGDYLATIDGEETFTSAYLMVAQPKLPN